MRYHSPLVLSGLLFCVSTGCVESSALRVSDDVSHGDTPPPLEARLPGGASESWWSSVQRGLAEAQYHPRENGQGLQAPNRAHNLRTYFGPTGIRLHDRTAAGSPELAGFSLVGMGRGTELAPVAAGTVTHAGTRVEIQRPGVVEWYENSPLGTFEIRGK